MVADGSRYCYGGWFRLIVSVVLLAAVIAALYTLLGFLLDLRGLLCGYRLRVFRFAGYFVGLMGSRMGLLWIGCALCCFLL